MQVYKWDGFCEAVRMFNSRDPSVFAHLYLGGDHSNKTVATSYALSNIAGLLAQCMWESGGEAPFTACDENNYRQANGGSWSVNPACTQRSDLELYHSLTHEPWACAVDPDMTMTAETWASWAPGPMKCEPGTDSEKCCWWGRGAIQTTGPNNYGKLQRDVIAHIPKFDGVDLCTNPEAMCQLLETRWLGAIFYWANK